MRKGKVTWLCGGAIAATFVSMAAHAVEARLMRYPDIAGDQLVYVYADKVWLSGSSGGSARLLSDLGTEVGRPKFSPDGTRVAFSANVGGNVDVYVVGTGGGVPSRVTHHPARDNVVDWTPAGDSILFSSTMSSPRAVYGQLHSVPARGGLPERVPVPYAETAALTEDGKTLIFTYLKDFQEEAWKRYYGGRAPDLWSYDLASGASRQLTRHPASDSTPMRVSGATYFLSERGASGRHNIWRIDPATGAEVQVTNFSDTDVRRPSTDGKRISFEAGGRLYVLDPATGEQKEVSINAGIALAEWRPQRMPVADRITSASLNSAGKVAIEARGEVFVYDLDGDIVSNVSEASGSAERFPRMSASGNLAYFSDRDGEYNLYVQTAGGQPKKVLSYSAGFRYNPFWSPDGKRVAFYDHEQVLWIVDIAAAKATRVDRSKWWFHWDLPDVRVSWSPDSRWISFASGLDNRNHAVFAYNVETAQKLQLTSGAFNDFAPVFDPSGNYLLLLSNRNFAPTFGDFAVDATWTYADTVSALVLPLNAAVASPNAPQWKMPEARPRVTIDAANSERRLALLGAKPGALGSIAAVKDGYVLLRQDNGPGTKNRLEKYDFGKNEPSELQAESGLSLADAAGSALLTRSDTKLYAIDLSKDGKPRELKTNKLTATVDRRAEYRQMFADAWRYERDFYYDPTIHGVDWNAVRSRYEALVPYAYVDDDLTFIVREMVGELEGGHVYASATAPRPRGDAPSVGLLGVDFAADRGAYKVAKIYRAGSRKFEHSSPLDDAALGVAEGTYILAVNGRALRIDASPWAAFEGLAGEIVELRVANTPDGAGARTIRVKAMASERKLRELAWVEDNRRKVETASGGRIGYIYVPNTGAEGQNELMIQYRSQTDKQALIIDERFNTGGALGDRMVELLDRPPLVYFQARNSTAYPLPELAFRGPKAMLINGWSYSGGDGFPLLFKTAKVGPLIGTRTWGGLIGPGMTMALVNGGFVSAPPIRVARVDGEWAEGNEGVQPSIEIDNDPGLLAKGTDQQLDRAIAEMTTAIQNYRPVPAPAWQKAGEWDPANRGAQE